MTHCIVNKWHRVNFNTKLILIFILKHNKQYKIQEVKQTSREGKMIVLVESTWPHFALHSSYMYLFYYVSN